MSAVTTILVTAAIIFLSAFFVAVEFSLMSARRHRLEDAAVTSRSARAALRSSAELTLLLAGAQLGITICTLALGAITKPAVHHALTPLLSELGLPLTAADVVAFILALVLVTFLHLVVGEMAPKSWAIAHPEKSAIMLALPTRAFMAATRPVLRLLNAISNALVRKAGVEPIDEMSGGQDPATLRALVEHSANVGALDASYRASLSGALDLTHLKVGDVLSQGRSLTIVPQTATVADVQAATRRTGHLRILVSDDRGVIGVLHVRDTLDLPPSEPIAGLTRPVMKLRASTPLHEALATMRRRSEHLAVIRENGQTRGVVTMADILPRVLPRTTG